METGNHEGLYFHSIPARKTRIHSIPFTDASDCDKLYASNCDTSYGLRVVCISETLLKRVGLTWLHEYLDDFKGKMTRILLVHPGIVSADPFTTVSFLFCLAECLPSGYPQWSSWLTAAQWRCFDPCRRFHAVRQGRACPRLQRLVGRSLEKDDDCQGEVKTEMSTEGIALVLFEC